MDNHNNSKYLAIFPGQGSQSIGMGQAFHEKFELAQDLFNQADQLLGFKLSAICLEGPAEKLTETQISQPAILTVSTIAYQIWQAEQATEQLPSVAAGHSLGEYSALVAAQAISFEDAVQLVHKRGCYMQEAVPKGQGKMLAVIGSEVAAIEEAFKTIEGVIEVANDNSPGQVVISGAAAAIDQFKASFQARKLVELDVSAPFHCSLMQPAADQLAKDLDATNINTPSFPVISNVSAELQSNPEQIRQALKDQVCGSVRWVENMQTAIASGITRAMEFGHGNVLTGLLKRIDKSIERVSISSPENIT